MSKYTIETDATRHGEDTSPRMLWPSMKERLGAVEKVLEAQLILNSRVPADSAWKSVVLPPDEDPDKLAVAVWNSLAAAPVTLEGGGFPGSTAYLAHCTWVDHVGTRSFDTDVLAARDVTVVRVSGQPSTPAPVYTEQEFSLMNRRRTALIRKELSVGLAGEEAAELERLEQEVDRYVDTVHPAPNQFLADLVERARKLKPGL